MKEIWYTITLEQWINVPVKYLYDLDDLNSPLSLLDIV